MERSKARRLLRAGVATVGALVFAGCTLLGSRDIVQCHTSSDCASSPLRGAVCSDGLCVSSAGALEDAMGGDTGAGDDARAPACTTTDDCKDDATICVDRSCVKLTDPATCPFLEPAGAAYRTPNVTFVGVYAYVGQAVNAEPSVGAVRLALKEINDPAPRVVAVLCRKEAKKPGDVIAHLASRKVPLVLGQFETADVASLSQFAKERGIALWSTLGNTRTVQQIESGGHVAFLLDELANTSSAYQVAFDRAEAKTNPLVDAGAGQDASRAEATRVALFVSPAEEANDLASKLTANDGGLAVNGKSTSSNGAASFRRYQLPQASLTEVWESYRPHVIIGVGGDEIVSAVGTVESSMGAAPRPAYVLSSFSKYNIVTLQNLTKEPAAPPGSRGRVVGVDFSGDPNKHKTFTDSLGPSGILRAATSFDILYDAMYVAALAAVAPRAVDGGTPGGPLAAADFIHGLESFRPADIATAEEVHVGGGANFANGRTLVSAGKQVHLKGVTGSWEFAKDHPSRRMGTSFFCFKAGGSGDLAYYVDPSAPTPCEP